MSIETRTKIASVTVGAGGIGIIDINNIPQTYSDLIEYSKKFMNKYNNFDPDNLKHVKNDYKFINELHDNFNILHDSLKDSLTPKLLKSLHFPDKFLEIVDESFADAAELFNHYSPIIPHYDDILKLVELYNLKKKIDDFNDGDYEKYKSYSILFFSK